MAEEEAAKMTPEMPRHQRYYALHRDEKLAREKERYDKNPEIIAKREQREKKKAEKEAEKEAKRIEKERIRQEKLELALATKQNKIKSGGGLDAILGEGLPV
jgi:bisphosphoglycerate-independent phosphoglycerate mutase (AlkP superfamily)